jgi:FMN phosphatase YigB (HAD superfamily)
MSNWDARLYAVLRDLGLSGRLSTLVLSCEVRAEKPAEAIFEAAARRAGFEAGEVALIGDEIRADGEGAIRAGWKQCLVRRPPASPPPDGMAWAPSLVMAVRKVLGCNYSHPG